ncbi:hypothetical protein DFS34DRAFT_603617 [Phlyctochytrium arcticum]|nr:hypothetical protein DFS34DRAFT_603617 [Phlyctochytrium arcticum]
MRISLQIVAIVAGQTSSATLADSSPACGARMNANLKATSSSKFPQPSRSPQAANQCLLSFFQDKRTKISFLINSSKDPANLL